MSSPYYDKVDIDLKFDQHRKYLEEIAKNMAKGVATTIYPETSEEDINALEEGLLYSLGKAGTYKFVPPFVIIEGQVENVLPPSFDVIVTKKDGIWKTVSAIEFKYDDTDIQNKITAIEDLLTKKVDSVDGKGLSTYDFDKNSKDKVDKLKINGEGKLFLNDKGEYIKGGNGSGSGFYNVTQKYPKADGGFYNLEEAISLLNLDQDLEEDLILGMIITFESADNVWNDYRYIGKDRSGISLISNWIEQGSKDVVKKVFLTKGVETTIHTPDEDGNLNLEIPIVEVDETLSPDGTNPVQGSAIYAEIKMNNSNVASSALLNEFEDDVKSLSLLNSEGEIISTTATWSAGGGGGGSTTNTKVILTKITENPIIKLGDDVKLDFAYDQVDSTTGASTGNGATATITVSRGGTTNTFSQELAAGTTTTIDVTKYLATGNSNVRIRVVTNDELAQVASIAWTIQVVQLILESSYNIGSIVNKGQNLSIPFSLTGTGSKTIELYRNGVLIDEKVVTSSSSTGAFSVDTTTINHGTHAFQMRIKLELASGKIIYSNTIYLGIMIVDSARTSTLVGSRFDYKDGRIIGQNETPVLITEQYANYTIIYSAYTPGQTLTSTEVIVNSQSISKANIRLARTEVTGRMFTSGTFDALIKANATTYPFKIEVSQIGVDLVEPTDGMLLKLTSDGKNNDDVNKEEWTYKTIQTKFENFTWTGGDGWINGALRLAGAAKATILFTPLAQGVINDNAFTFSTRLKISNTSDTSSEVLKCMDSDGVGFVITSQEARMVTKGNSTVLTKFSEGQEYNIGFVSFPKSNNGSTKYEKENSSMVYLYIDGVISGGIIRDDLDQVYQSNPQNIVISSYGKSIVDLYSLRFYSRALTDAEMLNTFLIDLIDPNILIDKFISNNILNESGNISVDNLPPYLPYMIITGKAENNRAMLLEAAAINDKDKRYNVDEILYINPLDQSMNFKLTNGSIRLQGTSSLAYPIKNYRFYMYNASKVPGILLQGVDKTGSGGKLVESNKYSFRKATTNQKAAIPVNCFCLKADYAESSSSHNTGTAKIVHEVNNLVSDKVPPQKLVSSSYNYDVRTTIDGFPMILFYRATLDDTPTFLSKFNFNNDKSTEDVFGFKDIPGYHDQDWVQTKFGGVNPTECWEFLNNDYPMGMFKDDDFITKGTDGIPNWLKVFEARFVSNEDILDEYEAGVKQPTYLQRLVQWIKSTDTKAVGLTPTQILERRTKFKNELSNYFDVKHLANYYTYTDVFGSVDQRVKNMMMAFWYNPEVDKMLAYMIFYDNDTILGVRNDGKLKYHWDIDHNTLDTELSKPGRPVYAYAGHDSVLWENLRNEFSDELKDAYVRIRARLTNDYIFKMYNVEQSQKYVERIYNIDAINKYVLTATQGVEITPGDPSSVQLYSFLELMQGTRTPHRVWWLTNRLNLLDAKYVTGLYKVTDVTWKGNSAAGAYFTATAARDYTFAFARESAILVQKNVLKDGIFTYTYDNEANIGTIFHLYGGDWMKKLDLSTWGGFTSINIPRLKALEEFILGKDGVTYSLPSVAIGTSLPLLRKLDIRNYTEIPTLDLSNCSLIEDVNATGCTNLSTIRFYPGAQLSKVRFPINYKNLSLIGLSNLTNENLIFDNIDSLETIHIENCKKLDVNQIFNRILAGLTPQSAKKYLRIDIGDYSDDGSLLRRLNLYNLGGLTTSGQIIEDKVSLTGTYRLTRSLPENEMQASMLKYNELKFIRPEYTVIEFNNALVDPANISNLDNQTGHKFNNDYIPSGDISLLLNKRKKVVLKRYGENGYLYHETEMNQTEGKLYLKGTQTAVDFTEDLGGIFIIEPAIWIKAINNPLTDTQQVLFASAKPTDSTYVDMTNTQYVVRNNTAIDITAGDTVDTSLITDILYKTVEVSIKDYKYIRFQGVVTSNNRLGWVYVDADNNIISRGNVDSVKKNFINGMNIYQTVPTNAVKIYYTIPTTQTFIVPRLSNKSIHDLEKWISRPERAISAGNLSCYPDHSQYYKIHVQDIDRNSPPRPGNDWIGENTAMISLGYTKTTDNYYDVTGNKKHFDRIDSLDYNILQLFFYSVFGVRNISSKVGNIPKGIEMTNQGPYGYNHPEIYTWAKPYITDINESSTQSLQPNMSKIRGVDVYGLFILGYSNILGTYVRESVKRIFDKESLILPTATAPNYKTKVFITSTLDIITINSDIVGSTSTYYANAQMYSGTSQVNGFVQFGDAFTNTNLARNFGTCVYSNNIYVSHSSGWGIRPLRLITTQIKFNLAPNATTYLTTAEIK